MIKELNTEDENMISTERKKLCANCRFFMRHYVNGNGRFTPANCAHCTKKRINLKRAGQFIEDKQACELWESAAARKEKRAKHVDNEITRLANLLEEYLEFLKLDSDK